MVVTVDIFLKEDLLKLLKNRFIVIIGDSSKLYAALSHLDHIFYCYKILCHFHSRDNMHMMEHSTVALQVWKLFILTSNSQNYDDIILSLEAWVIPMQHSFMGVQINCKWLWFCRDWTVLAFSDISPFNISVYWSSHESTGCIHELSLCWC